MFSNKFDVEFVYVFKIGIIRITIKSLFMKNNSFVFKKFISNFWQCFCYLHFSLNFHSFSQICSNKNFQVLKIKNKINVSWEVGGLIQLFKPKISTNSIMFLFAKKYM
jgi:hypothetical protein